MVWTLLFLSKLCTFLHQGRTAVIFSVRGFNCTLLLSPFRHFWQLWPSADQTCYINMHTHTHSHTHACIHTHTTKTTTTKLEYKWCWDEIETETCEDRRLYNINNKNKENKTSWHLTGDREWAWIYPVVEYKIWTKCNQSFAIQTKNNLGRTTEQLEYPKIECIKPWKKNWKIDYILNISKVNVYWDDL